MTEIRRRDLLTRLAPGACIAGLGLTAVAPSIASSRAAPVTRHSLPTPNPKFNLRTWARLNADLSGSTLYTCMTGLVYGFLPQSDDVTLAAFGRRLYGYASLTARKVLKTQDDEVRYRAQSWNCYTDASSGEFIETLLNPYTGKTVQCLPRSGPVAEQVQGLEGMNLASAPFPLESSQAGRPLELQYSTIGDRVWIRREGFTRFKPPDTTWFKLEADFMTHSAQLSDLLNPTLDHVPNECQHNLVAEWQTWMNMHGSPGHILFVGAGTHLRDPAEVPAVLARMIDTRFPGTLEATRQWSSDGRK